MPTLDLTPEKAQELLELTDHADDLPMLTERDRRNLRDLGGQLRGLLQGVPT